MKKIYFQNNWFTLLLFLNFSIIIKSMKRLVLGLILSAFLSVSICETANAGFLSDKKTQTSKNYYVKYDTNAIKQLVKKQSKYAARYDLTGLASLYSKDFKSADGFNKDVYFTLVKDTWKSYPDIVYTAEIKDIKIDGDSAEVQVYETSLATTTQIEESVQLFGELNSYSNSTYYLKKINSKWLFTGEKVQEEKSALKYGDTRFVKMELDAPKHIKAGEEYTATLTIEMPKNAGAIASIGRDVITYPQEKSEEVYRKIPNDNILERVFTANKEGKNEYNVASVGLAKLNGFMPGMAGIAFIITRVNVEEDNAEKNQ